MRIVIVVVVVALTVLMAETWAQVEDRDTDKSIFVPLAQRQGFEKIVGGQSGSISDFPYQAVIRVRGTRFGYCGASIITNRYLVCAAHCFVSKGEDGQYVKDDPTNFEILSMTDDLRNPAATTSIARVIFISGARAYNPRTKKNDIVMIQTTDDLLGTPINLPSAGQNYVGMSANVSGFGALMENGSSPLNLQYVTIKVLNGSDCPYTNYDAGVNVCAGTVKGGKDSCQGDSGGPLAVNGGSSGHTLIGIVSYGRGCARPGFPGVYTRVAAFLDFINQVSGGSSGSGGGGSGAGSGSNPNPNPIPVDNGDSSTGSGNSSSGFAGFISSIANFISNLFPFQEKEADADSAVDAAVPNLTAPAS